MTKILFSCMNIGFGHATRSLAVADELKKRGAEVVFCIGKPYDDFVRKYGYETITLSSEIKLPQKVGESFLETIKFINKNTKKVVNSSLVLRNAIKEKRPDIVVTDSEPTTPIVSKLMNKEVPTVMILHQPKLFIDIFSKGVNKIWTFYINKYCDKIILPDVVGIDIPQNLYAKTKKIGPIFRLADKKNKSKKTILFIPSFATANKSEFVSRIELFAKGHKKWHFVVLGQNEEREIDNMILKKKENVKNPSNFIASSDIVVLSGYSSLMEAVYYQKPVVMIPTQLEQRKIAELGERSGVLVSASFEDFSKIESLMNDPGLIKIISNNQKKYHTNGAKEAADEILSMSPSHAR